MDKKTIIGKIQKCLALSKSGNEHEAAAALRQAQKLMELHRVTDTELFIAGVTEATARAGAILKPVAWEAGLVFVVGRAFGCSYFFRPERPAGNWVFVGMGANADVAAYAFEVMLRQLRKSRSAFVKGECKRLVPASKVRRADLFCNAWVSAAARKIQMLAGQDGDEAAIDAYLLQHYPQMQELAVADRNANRKLRDKDHDAVVAGAVAGLASRLERGVGGAAAMAQIGSGGA
jgi:hypothetical protein